jgi:hypothetical protein
MLHVKTASMAAYILSSFFNILQMNFNFIVLVLRKKMSYFTTMYHLKKKGGEGPVNNTKKELHDN